jgi:hypothetical protein
MTYPNYSIKVLPVLFLFFTCYTLQAQKKHFLYLQAEDKQPFFIELNNKQIASTANGYMVLPRLRNGKYFFTAFTATDTVNKQKFICAINDKDLGYFVKKNTASWELINIQNNTNITANDVYWEREKQAYDTIKIEDDYTITTQPITKPDNKPPAKQADNKVNDNTEKKTNETTDNKSDTNNKESFKKGIIKVDEKMEPNGLATTYIDYTTTPYDTITLVIQHDKKNALVDNTPGINPTKPTPGTTPPTPKNVKNTDYNQNCVLLASDAEFNKVRKAMSYESTDDKMISTGIKKMGKHCFYTEQISKLGLLFISEQSRLKFFIAAKPLVYDLFNYASLETNFTLAEVMNNFRKALP